MGKRQSHRFADVLGNVRLLGHVRKSSIAVVAIENVGCSHKTDRRAVSRNSGLHAVSRSFHIVVQIIGNKQIEQSVVVVIKPPGICPPGFPIFGDHSAHACFFCYVGESAVPVVVVKRRRLAVKIVRMAVAAHAGAAVAAIEITLGGPVDIVGDDEVELAVIVIVEPCRARCP